MERLSRPTSGRTAMLKSMKLGSLALAALALWTGTQTGGEKGTGHADKDHVVVTPSDIQWGPAPPALPAGAQAAVLTGDPTKTGPYVLRVKLPDGYKVPPHWHPTDENVTVLQGSLLMGRGEKFDPDATAEVQAGGFSHMPKGMRHFAAAKGETVLQVHGTGPFEIHYV